MRNESLPIGSSIYWMKKTVLMTSIAAATLLSINASAQQLVPKWRNETAGSSSNRDMEYNPATGNLLLVKSGLALRFQSSDGLSAGSDLNNTGVTGGIAALGGIAVTTDGVIYACNYVNSATGPFKIYRWENESASPILLFSTSTTGRSGAIGGSLSLHQSGTNVHFIASGNGTEAFYIFHDGSQWASKILVSDNQAMASGAAFVDFDESSSGEFRILAKTSSSAGKLFAFSPASTSPITLSVQHVYAAPLHNAFSGIHSIGYDPVTGLIGAGTVVDSTGFSYTNLLIATKGGAGTNLLNPVDLLTGHDFVATGGNAGVVGGVSWGSDGRLYISTSATGAGLHAYDVTTFLVSGPNDTTNSTGQSATITAVFGGSELTYEWKKGATILSNNAKYSGATSATLTITDLLLSDADTYTVTVSGVASSSATAAATLSVIEGPTPADIAGIRIINGEAVLRVDGAPNRTHHIEAATDLLGEWLEIGTVVAPVTGNFFFTNTVDSTKSFYRAVTE